MTRAEVVKRWLDGLREPGDVGTRAWPYMTRDLRLGVVQAWMFQTRQDRDDRWAAVVADEPDGSERWHAFPRYYVDAMQREWCTDLAGNVTLWRDESPEDPAEDDVGVTVSLENHPADGRR